MKTSFYDLPLLTAPGQVFTPRSSTEQLVDEALERIDGVPMRIADVGTGSGAVAIARADGKIVFSLGDVGTPVYPRSSLKPIQALP